jgi:hypothetical protein
VVQEQRAAQAAAALVRYRDNDRIAEVLGKRGFAEGLAVRAERLRQANLDVGDARSRVATYDLPSVDELRRTWPEMSHAEQRELLGRVIDAVFVAPGHAPLEQRVTICPAGTAPPLPRRGMPTAFTRRIQPRRGWINPVKITFERPANPEDEPWVTSEVVAAHFGVTRSSVKRWGYEGLPSKKFQRGVRYRLSECQEWFDGREATRADQSPVPSGGRDAP